MALFLLELIEWGELEVLELADPWQLWAWKAEGRRKRVGAHLGARDSGPILAAGLMSNVSRAGSFFERGPHAQVVAISRRTCSSEWNNM